MIRNRVRNRVRSFFDCLMPRKPTYTAFYQSDHPRIIYQSQPNDGTLIARLPGNACPAEDPRSTYLRGDGGDPFDFALFRAETGELIVVKRDGYTPFHKLLW